MARRRKRTTRVVARLFCEEPELQDLTPGQVAALHEFKHEVLAAAYSLFQKVPEDRADELIRKFMIRLYEELQRSDD